MAKRPSVPALQSFLAPLVLLVLTGCAQNQLPACIPEPVPEAPQTLASPDPEAAPAAPPASPAGPARQLLVGIDGSGSMLGHVEAPQASGWSQLLQAITLAAGSADVSLRGVRVGGGKAQPFGTPGSLSPAREACFFGGCGGFPPVASSMQSLWQLPAPAGQIPLRLLVGDLEVNQGDIANLVGAIRADVARGASVGVLALRLPFRGRVFNSESQVIHTGPADRPIYLLATGQADQVSALLEGVRQNLGLKGVSAEQHLSLFRPGGVQAPLEARALVGVPPLSAQTGIPLRLGGRTYGPTANGDYRFIKLGPESVGFIVSSTADWSGGTTRPDLGVFRLEAIPLPPSQEAGLNGVRVRSITIAGTDLRAEIGVSPSTPSGLLRATIPRGSLPAQWWLDWDRSDPRADDARDRTDGLLLLMTSLNQLVHPGDGPPAVAFCVAFQR